jgi:hypothetical protein
VKDWFLRTTRFVREIPSVFSFTPPSTGYTYVWTGPNGYSSTVEDPSIVDAVPVKAGTYSAVITAGEGCKYTYNTTVTVNPKPEFTATTTTNYLCEGDSCTVSFSPTTNMVNTKWYKKDAALPGCVPTGAILYTSVSQVVMPDSTTTYVVISENQFGCRDTSCVKITVDIMPKMASPFATAKPLCYGRGTVVTITPGWGGVSCTETYEWKMDNGAWQSYTSGTVVGQGATDSVVVRVIRSCAQGCISRTISSKWSVTKPQTVGAGSTIYNCTDAAGYIAAITATDPTPSSGQWYVTDGPGSIVSPTSLSTTVGALSRTGATSTILWVVTNAHDCKDTAVQLITPPAVDTSLVSKYSNEFCLSCPIQNGTTYSYYDANGRLLSSVTDSADAVAIGATTFCAQLPYNVAGDPAVGDVQSVNSWILDVGYLPQPYLPRAWNINTTNDAPMTISLYFTDEEVAALQGATLNNGGYYYFENPPELFLVALSKYDRQFHASKGFSGSGRHQPEIYKGGGLLADLFRSGTVFYLLPVSDILVE